MAEQLAYSEIDPAVEAQAESELIGAFTSAAFRGISRRTLLEWAEASRVVAGSSPRPGLWETSYMPPAREPMLAYDRPEVRQITIMCAAQMMKTEFILNCLFYHLAEAPMSQLMALPDDLLAKTIMKDRIEPAAAPMGEIRRKLMSRRGMDGTLHAQSLLSKTFADGNFLQLVSASSRTGLDSRTAPRLYADETDKMETADFAPRLLVRAVRHKDSKFVCTSTPLHAETSFIYSAWKKGSRGKYAGRCPYCAEYVILEWKRVVMDPDSEGKRVPATARYRCQSCDKDWSEPDRVRAINEGAYVHEDPDNLEHRSYHANRIGDKHETLARLAVRHADAVDVKESTGDWAGLQRFYNDDIGWPWSQELRSVSARKLFERLTPARVSLHYGTAIVDKDASVITASVDVQGEWLELEIAAWGWHEKSKCMRRWGLFHKKIDGDSNAKEPWNELLGWLEQKWETADGRGFNGVSICVVDTGFQTDMVKSFIVHCQTSGWAAYGLKGHGQAGKQNIQVPPNGAFGNFGEIVPVLVSVNDLKFSIHHQIWRDHTIAADDRLYQWMDGFGYDLEYFKGFTAERIVDRIQAGRPIQRWERRYSGIRNEPIDLAVYNIAAMQLFAFLTIQERAPHNAYQYEWFFQEMHKELKRGRGETEPPPPNNVVPFPSP